MTCYRVALALPVTAMLLGVMAGCGGSDLDLASVHGTVTMDEKPLPNATVMFTPVTAGKTAYGRTNEAGEYELIFSRSSKGAVPGEYAVRISTYEEIPDENDKPVITPESVPVQYNHETELKATVTEEGPNEFSFDLTSEGEVRQPPSNS